LRNGIKTLKEGLAMSLPAGGNQAENHRNDSR
jgi:hypothetical protein